ncbi:signal peptidase II [Paracrocinitomix mangrovi]|uniref:signal peptidase II n=1 Tax=Paracrocinitomix mangrovi TaxID=2862509 RepID=UPI001C8F00EC|nr:signal peptidase II [Paracrocinitomix mangrovi]UKN00792.1 signal peptidase II [Paracrocinitomix mangrovi]
MRKGKISIGWKVVILIGLILIIDQIVKVWIKTSFEPYETSTIVDGFFQLHFIENRGMAFGTTFGSGALPKYALSIFRMIAIIGIAYYIIKLIKEKNTHTGLILSVGLIFAGATGNLIDGMLYDYIWDVDCNIYWNQAKDTNGEPLFDQNGFVCRPTGFLQGSVVDMFQFTLKWPEAMPFGLGGKEIFGAIWNIADAAISIGVILIIINYRRFFRRPESEEEDENKSEEETTTPDASDPQVAQ